MAGTVQKRGENSWRLSVSDGFGPGGNRQRYTRTVHAKNKHEAEKLLAQFIAEVEKGQYLEPAKRTLAEFTERWLRDHGEVNLAPKTFFRYKQILDSRVLPALGHIQIDKIKPTHLIEFYKNLQESGIRIDGKPGKLSTSTVAYHHRVISSILNDAVQWQIIPSNPASRVKPPKIERKSEAFYNENQTWELFSAADTEPLKYNLLIILAVTTGLRRGELMGLEWKDVNFENNSLRVRQASQYIPGKGLITKDPKNKTSKRCIAVPQSVMEILKKYKVTQNEERLALGDVWIDSDRIFTTFEGKPMHPDTISKWFPEFLKRHHLSPIPFHGLRHTSATLLIAQGVNLKEVSNRLGHSNISTTMDIYAHALKSADRDAADKMEAIFAETTSGNKKNRPVNL